jgi:hypothetical protein
MRQMRVSIKQILITASFVGVTLTGNAQVRTPKIDISIPWTDTLKVNNNGQLQNSYKEVTLKKNFFRKPKLNLLWDSEETRTKTYQSTLDQQLYVVLSGRYESEYSKSGFEVFSKRIIYKKPQQNIEYSIRIDNYISDPEILYIIDSADVLKVHRVQMFTDALYYIMGRDVAATPVLLMELVRNKITLQERIDALVENKPRSEAVSITQKLKRPFLLNYIDTITIADNEGKRVKVYKDVSEYESSNHRTYQSVVDKNLYLNISYSHINNDEYKDTDAANLTFIYGGKKTNDGSPAIEVRRDRNKMFVVGYDMGLRDPEKSAAEIVQFDPIIYGNLLRELTLKPASISEIVKQKIALKASL